MVTKYYDVQSEGLIRVHHLTPCAKDNEKVIVFCHPTGFCGLCFASISSHLRNLNIYAIDMRSHGYSQRVDVSKWSGFARDLDVASKFIIQHSKAKQIIGVGISSGSSAHILNNARNPELYQALYLCEPILFPPGADLKDRERLAQSAEKRREIFSSKDEAFIKFSKKGLSELNLSTLGLYCAHGLKDTDYGSVLRCNKEDEREIYLSGGANGVYESLEKIKVPTVVVRGEHSKTIDFELAKMIAGKIINGTVETLADTGHFTLLDDPVSGAKSIMRFIESLT